MQGRSCSEQGLALRRGWRALWVRQEQAQGTLIAALDLLAGHYGLKAGRAA